MDNTEKLLKAFIEAMGYEITAITSASDADVLEMKLNGFDIVYDDYKVTKKIQPLPDDWIVKEYTGGGDGPLLPAHTGATFIIKKDK